jgi:hypothetical protein
MRLEMPLPLRLSLALSLSATLAGCAGDLRHERRPEPAPVPDAAPGAVQIGRVRLQQEGAGRVAQVDARLEEGWVYLALSGGGELTVADPATSLDWDLGLQRFRIKLNGGVSGPGQGAVALLPGVAFDAVTAAPADGYLQDAPETEAGAGPDLAFLRGDAWYSYDGTRHTLTPRDVTYVVRSARGAHFKLRIAGYYDDAGTSGYPTLRYAPVPSP